jgi:hypothetical protein
MLALSVATARVLTTAAPAGVPSTVGACVATTISQIGVRVEGRPDSGAAVTYANGLSQASHAIAPQVGDWKAGDEVRMCLVHAALQCPQGSSRGGFYEVTDRRTSTSWTQADTTLACGT